MPWHTVCASLSRKKYWVTKYLPNPNPSENFQAFSTKKEFLGLMFVILNGFILKKWVIKWINLLYTFLGEGSRKRVW